MNMEKYNFIKTFKDFLNEGVEVPKNYDYDCIIIGIYNKKDFDYISEYLSSKYGFDKIILYDVNNYIKNGGLYFRLEKYFDELCHGPIHMLEEISKSLNFTYDKIFTIDDIKNGTFDNIIRTGINIRDIKNLYKPKNIIRESIDDLLLERSSLTKLGVPNYIMKYIQKDFAIPPYATWDKINLKSDAKDILRNEDMVLLLQISLNSIKVFVTHFDNGEKKFFLDNYVYRDGDWGGEYEKQPRENLTMTQLFHRIKTESLIYKLNDDFSLIRQPVRKRKKVQKEFNDFTEQFKKDFLKNFESILKRLVGAKYNSAKKEIQEKARRIEIENKMLLSGLSDPFSGPNSLTILDEFLLSFEEEYTEFFGERIDIKELSEYFTRDKIMTSFMYYIYTGKILQ